MSLNYNHLYNIILDGSQLKKPELHTVKMIKKNIYHPVGEDEYLAFKLNSNNKGRLNSISSNGNICEFENYFLSQWELKNHIDIYITGSSQSLSKFDIVCGGSLNRNIPFNLDSKESKSIKIRNTEFKMVRRSEKFRWKNITEVESDMAFDLNKLETKGFNYNILTVNSSNKINTVSLLN